MDNELNNDALTSKFGFTNLGLFLFIQRWMELFDNETIDSYQVHFLNAHWIIKETIDTIALIKTGTIKYANLPPLIAESKTMIINDICLMKNAKILRGRLIENLAKAPKAEEKAAITRLEYQLRQAFNQISPYYLEWLTNDLKEAINNNELKSINKLTEALATELVNCGWSPRSLRRLVKYICFKGQGSFDDMWNAFVREITAPCKKFVCYYPCEGSGISLLMDAKIQIKNGADIISEYPNSKSTISSTSKYIEVETQARAQDIHSAVEASKQEISKIQAIINYTKTGISVGRSLVVIFPNGQKAIPYNINDTIWKSTLTFDHPFFVTFENFNKILINQEIHDGTELKLINLVRQYDISLETLSPETVFTNLWTALESFVVSGQHPSIIDHVRKLVPSILCSTYVYHILRYFLLNCENCNITPVYQGIEISTNKPNLLEVAKLIDLLKTPLQFNNLLSACSKYELLKLRCQELEEKMQTNKTVLDLYEAHYNRLSWHLQRLYRVRNSLVHSSECTLNVLPLTFHLNHYLRSTIAQVVYRLNSGSYKRLEELFAAYEDNYFATIEVLKSSTPYDNDLVLRGAFL